MNNYYEPKSCTDLDDAVKAVNNALRYKNKVTAEGEVYFLTKNEYSKTSFFTLSLFYGEPLQVFLNENLTGQLENLGITEGSVISVTGNLSLYRFKEKPPILQIYATEITKKYDTLFPRANYSESQSIKEIKQLNKIAIISNEYSRGYKDFMNGLPKYFRANDNACKLYQTEMEGSNAITGIVNAIERINNQEPQYKPDVICIVRGGSDKYTLSYVFDNKDLCDAIINSQIPVLTGIGHFDDYMQADRIADFPTINNERQYCGTPSQLARLVSRLNYQFRHPPKPVTPTPAAPKNKTSTKPAQPLFGNGFLVAIIILQTLYILSKF